MALPPDQDSKITDPNNVVEFDFSTAYSNNARQNQKMLVFGELIKLGAVRVVLDASKKGVKVPPEFSRNHDLKLDFFYDFSIIDFSFDNWGIFGTLKFGQGPFFVRIPWTSIYGIQELQSQKAAIFDEDAPKMPNLALVKEAKEAPVAESTQVNSTEDNIEKKKPFLRLISDT